ncbi:MAG: pyridoxamine 5'-phosphate oxidase family protein [Nitrospira sp.]|nr:pyridoxamine 5'-phosphate oxidase family protein [Nitrospira sp.]
MSESMTNDAVCEAWMTLAQEVRTGVLLTMRNGKPFGSHVPYVLGENWTRAYLHLSRLALHTQHLLQDSHVSLFLSELDHPEKNPLALRRMNLQGTAAILQAEAPAYTAIKERYLARFPKSAMMFGFSDFALWELHLQDAHLVLGFGQAYQATAVSPELWTHQQPERKK